MYEKSAFVFWTTLILYLITLFTVSYVGVYLTYIAIPMIIISGLIMKLSKPKKETKTATNATKNFIKETGKAANSFLEETSNVLEDINKSLEIHNEKTELIIKKTENLREYKHKLELKKIEPEIELKYTKDNNIKKELKIKIKEIENEIRIIEEKIERVTKSCELEVARKHKRSLEDHKK